jgi:hypothetical protein
VSEWVLFAIAAVAVVAAVVAVIVARARRSASRSGSGSRPPGPVDPFADTDATALRGDPTTLKPGDLAEIRGQTYAVRGSLRLAEGAWSWMEHLLDDAQGRRMWLSVEQDPDLELILWTQVPSATVRPGRPTVDFDGRRYTRQESGRARFTGVGSTGLDPSGVVEYHDYAAPDGPLLSFERFGDPGGGDPGGGDPGGAGPGGSVDTTKWEVARGERLHRAELQIFARGG